MFSDPILHIEHLDIDKGMKVADIGAGSGHHTIHLAKRVGDTGRIYAIDVQKDLLARIKSEAHHHKIHNIEIVWADIEKLGATRIKDNLIDRAILSNVLFQLEDKRGAVGEIKRILRQGGKLVVVDWSDSFSQLGPHKNMVISPLETVALFSAHGFEKEREFDAGSHHYGIIFKKV